ncbi:MAG: recombinase family protein, partial [Anaerotardibacter sp.]
MSTYGYARVSTRDQNLDRQLHALVEWGVPKRNIFTEKASGKDFERPEYLRLVKRLKAGDVLVIKSIDRLGRNYDEVITEWRTIVKDKQVDVVVLDMPLLDTRQT